MAWDAQNRLVSCALNGPTSTFTSGADGLRCSMTNPMGVTTDYVYDGQSMVREMQRNASGVLVPTATYLTGPRGPEYRRDDTRTEPDGQGHTFGVTRWYVYDGLGSVVGEVDPLGNLTCSDEYDVYGNVRGRAGTASTAHGFVGALGHLSDASTGLIYMRARYYDPSTGRFASEDSDAHGKNWFVYCHDNPVDFTDSSGKADDPISQTWENLNLYFANHPLNLLVLMAVLNKLPAMTALAKETIGMGLMLAADEMISGGKALMGKGAVSLTVYGISSTANQEGEAVDLGNALTGAAQGLAGVSELAAGIALKSVAEFMYLC